ncbi:MAG: glutaminyl-peptide cyclotransferase [Acidobacteriota bacterium]
MSRGTSQPTRSVATGWSSLLACFLLALSGCAARGPGAEEAKSSSPRRVEPASLRVDVVERYPHDSTSYTQGLLWQAPFLYESSGGYGESRIRRTELGSVEALELLELDSEVFGEGLALVGEELFQLTWKEGLLYVYDREPLELREERRYPGIGWGLTFDGTHVVMSDGSHVLTFRDPETFKVERRLKVRRRGSVQADLNELEFVDGSIYANVYQTDEIVRIDAESGVVTAVIDASGLLTVAERRKAEVLNGIAYRAENETFLITGKYWPHLFEVRFVEIP